MTAARGGGTGPRRRALAARLLGAQALVLLAGAATSWIVASAVAPGIFHTHLMRAGLGHTPSETIHVERAFSDSLIIALGVALVTSVLMALGVTAYFTRRVQRSTAAVAQSARDIAAGQYRARVPSPGLGTEFDQMADTINQLAERLGAVETTRRRILADLAHEMRTPLASIEAHLEAVEDGIRGLDDNTLMVLHEGTARLQRLAEDIGSVSQAEEGRLDSRPVPTSAQHLLESAAATARDALDAKGVRLVVEASNVRDQVLVDPQRMAQVLGNLLDNALRHTPHGGTVSLALHRPDPGWVELDVTDTGDGIAPEHLPHLFERFYRADPSRGRARGGSGIGLTISRALVEAHGGGLSVTSSGPGRGSTFTVRLPVAD